MKFLWFLLILVVFFLATKEIDKQTNGKIGQIKLNHSKNYDLIWIEFFGYKKNNSLKKR